MKLIDRVCNWYQNLTPGRQKAARLSVLSILIGGLFALLIGVANWALTDKVEPAVGSTTNTPGFHTGNPLPNGTVASTQAQQQFTWHTVRQGEFIIKIAEAQGVPWESIVLANEATLVANAQAYCEGRPERYTHNSGRRGHFCNFMVYDKNGKPLVYANTLKPGDELRIPSKTAPTSIQQAIDNVHGKRIVVVIDDTGSMRGEGDGVDDRARVSAWWLQAVKNSGKEIARVIMFANGGYRELSGQGEINFLATGGIENTRGAIERAIAYNPDAIVLVTDEPGDDWSGFNGMEKFPPVLAHSLDPRADASLVAVANITRGTFLSSHVGPIGLASTSR